VTTDVVPLGTAASIPAHGRHLSALALQRKGRVLLFDCGEGTQYQLLDAGVPRARIDAVFVTHLHGDHFFGLPGLISTLANLQRTAPVTLVGPEGLGAFLRAAGVNPDRQPFAVTVTEWDETLTEATVYRTDEFAVTARPLEHRTPTAGYRFQEHARPGHLDAAKARALGVTHPPDLGRLKAGETVTTDDGRTVTPGEVVGPERPGIGVAYVTDTRPCAGGQVLADGADLLYHDATFADALHARAVETGHATAREAAEVARTAGARRLLLGHISARYSDPQPLVDEARAVFAQTEVAEEGRRYTLDPRKKEPERGGEEP
jgi:ribonuclease Z